MKHFGMISSKLFKIKPQNPLSKAEGTITSLHPFFPLLSKCSIMADGLNVSQFLGAWAHMDLFKKNHSPVIRWSAKIHV